MERLGRLNASYVEANTARLQLETQIAELKKLAKEKCEEILEFPGIDRKSILADVEEQIP